MTFSWASLYTNQSVTRGSFITELRIRIDEDIADFISDTQLNSLINSGIIDLNRRIGGFLRSYADQTVSGATSYALPTDLTSLKKVDYLDSSNRTRTLIKLNSDEIERNYSSGYPEYYSRSGDYISIYGNPTSGTIRIYGSKQPTLPTTSGSYIDFPYQYIELLYAWVEWKYWVRRRSSEDIKIAAETFANLLADVSDSIEQEYSDGVTMYGNFK